MAIPLKSFRDEATGKFISFAWPGGYPIIYLDKNNSVFCPDCANDIDPNGEIPDDPIIAGDIFYEGAPMECDGGCGKMIESAYGDPDEDDEAKQQQGELEEIDNA